MTTFKNTRSSALRWLSTPCVPAFCFRFLASLPFRVSMHALVHAAAQQREAPRLYRYNKEADRLPKICRQFADSVPTVRRQCTENVPKTCGQCTERTPTVSRPCGNSLPTVFRQCIDRLTLASSGLLRLVQNSCEQAVRFDASPRHHLSVNERITIINCYIPLQVHLCECRHRSSLHRPYTFHKF